MVGLIAGFPQQAIFRAIQGRNKGSGNGNPDAGTIDEMQSAKRVATRVEDDRCSANARIDRLYPWISTNVNAVAVDCEVCISAQSATSLASMSLLR